MLVLDFREFVSQLFYKVDDIFVTHELSLDDSLFKDRQLDFVLHEEQVTHFGLLC